jgi:hypothetical protein
LRKKPTTRRIRPVVPWRDPCPGMTLTGYQQRNALFSQKVRVSQAADRLIRAMITQLGGTSRYAFDRDVRGTTVGAYDVARR